MQLGDLPQSPGHGCADTAPLDLVCQPLDRRRRRGHLASEARHVTPEPIEARFAVALLRAVVAVQSAHRQTQRVGRGPTLLCLGFGAQHVDLRRQAAGLQAGKDFGFFICRPRRHLCLAVPCARFVKGDASGVPGVAQRLLFGGDGRMQRLDLGRERVQAGLLLLQLQVLGGGIELDEHVAALHLLAEDQVGRHDPAGDRRLDGMGGLAHLQARRLADRVERHLGCQ